MNDTAHLVAHARPQQAGGERWSRDFRVDGWLVQPGLSRVSRGGTTMHLRPQLIDLLECLATRPGSVFSKNQLLAIVWNDRYIAASGIARCIAELRQALSDDAREPRVIETIPKRGYRLIAPVEDAGPSDGAGREAADPPLAIGPARSPAPAAASWRYGFSRFLPGRRSMLVTAAALVGALRHHGRANLP